MNPGRADRTPTTDLPSAGTPSSRQGAPLFDLPEGTKRMVATVDDPESWDWRIPEVREP